jgi:hypothetical protein
MDSYVIHPVGGLCNHLRVIFSYLAYCKSINKSMIVIWESGPHCPGFFLDYFEPIPNVTFLTNNTNNYRIDYKGFSVHPDYRPEEKDIYQDLKLIPSLQSEIDDIVHQISPYIATHIRRTDHIHLAKSANAYTDDQEFMSFMNLHKDLNIYVATDNLGTQTAFYDIYKDRIKCIEFIKPSINLRQTNLKQSIKDIFLCIKAKEFKGSGYSSFTDIIIAIRRTNAL